MRNLTNKEDLSRKMVFLIQVTFYFHFAVPQSILIHDVAQHM